MTERITDSQLLGELGETAIKKFVLKMQLIYCSAATDASRGRSAVHRFPEERGSAWAESWLAPALLGAGKCGEARGPTRFAPRTGAGRLPQRPMASANQARMPSYALNRIVP